MKPLTPEQRDRIWKTFTTATEEARDVQWDWFENVLNANTTEDEPKVNVEQDKDIDAEKENYLCVDGVVYHLLQEDELVQAIDIIKSIEYIDVSDYFERDTKWKHCPECGYKEPDGHWKTCRIGLFLDKLQQEDSE